MRKGVNMLYIEEGFDRLKNKNYVVDDDFMDEYLDVVIGLVVEDDVTN